MVPRLFATQTAYATPLGSMSISAAANSDRLMSVPFARNAVWSGSVSSLSGNNITISGTPNWTSNAFASSAYHYVRMLSGAQKGQYFSILSNSADTLSVDPAGLNLGSISPGDTAEVAPYWTLGTLFPGTDAGISFVSSTSAMARQTEILLFDPNYVGINPSASSVYYHFNGAWRRVGTNLAISFDNTILYPDIYFIQRNKATATNLRTIGRVQPAALGTILVANSAQNDNSTALAYPRDVTLNGSGLINSGFSATVSPLNRQDQLLWYDPTLTGINNSASAIYIFYNGAWRKIGANLTLDFGNSVTLKAGYGYIIRKAANGTTAPWVFQTGF